MKKIMILGLLAVSVLTIAGCSNNTNQSTNSDLLNDGDQSQTNGDEIFLYSTIPHEFICFDYVYKKVENTEEKKFTNMIGYLVRECDIEYWVDFDSNSNYLYAYDTTNELYRLREDRLNNRFELYSDEDNFQHLAIEEGGCFTIYEKESKNEIN